MKDNLEKIVNRKINDLDKIIEQYLKSLLKKEWNHIKIINNNKKQRNLISILK